MHESYMRILAILFITTTILGTTQIEAQKVCYSRNTDSSHGLFNS